MKTDGCVVTVPRSGRVLVSLVVVISFVLAMVPVGCSDDGSGGISNEALVGSWEPLDGEIFRFFPEVEFVVLELREDSTGVATFRHPESNVLACVDLLFTQLSEDAVFMEIEVFNEYAAFVAKSYAYDIQDDLLGLTDSTGRRQIFSRLSSSPEGSECVKLAPTVLVEASETRLRDTGLVSDGAALWFGANAGMSDALIPFDLNDEALGTPLDRPSGVNEVHAYDGSLFWLIAPLDHIATGRDRADVEVDTIDTELDLGHKLYIGAMAWDGAHLWLAGRSASTDTAELLEVDPTTKTLVNRYDFSIDLRAMTWDGTHLWGIVPESPSPIVQIDLDSQQVSSTYEIFGYSSLFQELQGIAAVGEDLYVLLEDRLVDSATIIRSRP